MPFAALLLKNPAVSGLIMAMSNDSRHEPLFDPRGRGFRHRSTVESVQTLIDQNVGALPAECLPTGSAGGRVLAHDVVSGACVPHFRRAAMDGFALVAAETFGSDLYTPAVFEVVGRSRPGSAFVGTLQPGQAVAIATGAPMPAGADAVVPVEMTETSADGRLLKVKEPVTPGRHVGQAGEDILANTLILKAGRLLRPQDLGVLSAIGQASVEVLRRPQVAILVTGDELLPAFSTAGEFMISDMNSPMLQELVQRDGGQAMIFGPLRDNAQELENTIRQLAENPQIDAIFINGGSSTGPEDHAPQIVRACGRLLAHGVALRPASPTGFGMIGAKPVLLLPGNPVSCLCAYDFFGRLIVRKMAGRPLEWPYRQVRGQLSQKIASTLGRVDYVRVLVEKNQVQPIATGGASILSGTSRADGFLVVPAGLEGYPVGASVDVWLYDIP